MENYIYSIWGIILAVFLFHTVLKKDMLIVPLNNIKCKLTCKNTFDCNKCFKKSN